jgi:hypothetical protein
MAVWQHPRNWGGDPITIQQSGDNEEVEITHKDCNTAHRTLGVMINPAGTQTAEAERLVEKGKKIAAKMQADYLPRSSVMGSAHIQSAPK